MRRAPLIFTEREIKRRRELLRLLTQEWDMFAKDFKSEHTFFPPINMDEIATVAERYFAKVRINDSNQEAAINDDIPNIIVEEVRKALKGMNRSKNGGTEGLTTALVKDARDYALYKLSRVYTRCLYTHTLPIAWKNITVKHIRRAGIVSDTTTCRPISLLSIIEKLYTKIIINRVSARLDENQPREQAGFRSGYSTIDHIHVVNQLVEKSYEYNRPLCVAFIDY